MGRRVTSRPLRRSRPAEQLLASTRAARHAGACGRAGDPLYDIRKLLLKANQDLDPRLVEAGRRSAGGDPDGEVTAAWQLKELVSDPSSRDLDQAHEVLEVVYAWADTGDVPEMRRLAGTLRRCEVEMMAYFTTGGASNGPTEAVNLTIKQIKRVGRGFPNFDNYRLRLLLHCDGCTWQTQPAARTRGRRPRGWWRRA
jgi:transposase